MILLIFVCFYQRRKTPPRTNQPNEGLFLFSNTISLKICVDELIDRHEQIEKIREKQQKAYEEQKNQFEQRQKQVSFLL